MPFTLTPLNELLATPPSNQWLIEDFIEKDSIGMIFGKPESAKSLLAMDIAFCVATGIDWNGDTTEQGKVIYIAGEGQNGISKRFKALSEKHGTNPCNIHISSDSVSLINEESANNLKDAIQALGETPALIIIDTLHRNFGDGDENSSKDMGKFIKNVDEKLKDTGATVLIIHHTGHDAKGRARGSSSLRASLDVEYSLTKNNDLVTLKCTKAKEFKRPEPTSFKLKTHTFKDLAWVDDGGVQLESVVLKPTVSVSSNKLTGNSLVVFTALEDEIDTNGISIPVNIKVNLPDVKCIKLKDWKTRAFTDLGSRKSEAKRQAFNRCKCLVLKINKITIKGEYVWLSVLTEDEKQ